MVSLLTQEKLVSLFQGICEGERKVEVCRQLLCQPLSFEPHAAFRRLDRLSLGYLSHTDLSNFFVSNSNPQLYSDIALLLRNIDKYRDSRITYEEFTDAILPKQDAGLKAIATSRAEYFVRPNEFLEYELEMALMRLFQQIITNARQYDLLREELRRQYDFNASACFELTKDALLSYVDLSSLDRFLRIHSRILPENELQAGIMFGDVDGDGRLNYSEFSDLLIPGIPAPVQTSPSKIRLSPQRNAVAESSVLRFSPSRIANRASAYRPVASPRSSIVRPVASPRSSIVRPVASPRGSPLRSTVAYPMGSPGGQKVAQKHEEENYQKVDDNIKYSQYIQQSRENSIRKSMSPRGGSPSRVSPSKVYQSSYIASPSRVSRTYASPARRSQLPVSESPSRFSEKEQLMQLLRKMINSDRELQNIKTELSVKQDFNLLDAFRLFDINQNQNISKLEFENGLNKMGIFPSQDQIYLFFKIYDLDADGFLQLKTHIIYNFVIRYGDFTKVFYSPNQTQVNLLNSRAPGYVEPLEGQNDRDVFTFDTRQTFKRFLNQIFDTETTIDQFRETLQKRPLFNLYDGFKTLDLDQDGVINYEELKIMLNSYGIYTTENDMINLFERFDKDKDGKIKYQEFVSEVAPKSPQRYSKY